MTRSDIVAEARSWIGTPFVHQGRSKGRGVDCAGHVAGVALAIGAIAQSAMAEITRLSRYGLVPRGSEVIDVLGRLLIPVEEAKDGDVIALRFRGNAQHVGIRGTSTYGSPTLIHALYGDGARAVVEHRISQSWNRRIQSVFSFRGVE